MLLNFGQPADGIIQTAYVVPDIQAAMQRWIATMNVGPWFLLDRFTGVDPTYRGQPTEAAVAIAMAFAGHMQIELIQPLDDLPSVYKETIEARGYGFHHWGYAATDWDAAVSRFEGMGFEQAYRLGVPSGGEVAYMDAKGAMPGFVEVIPSGPGIDEAFTRQYLASVGWHGEDPIRPFG